MVSLAKRGADAASETHGVLGRLKVFGHDGELIAAKTADKIRLAYALPEPRRNLGQERIAGGVPERVVDVLEAIEIEGEHGHQMAVASRPRHGAFEMLVKLQPVRQVGQRVVHGQVADLVLGEPALADAPRGDRRGHREAHDNEETGGQGDDG
jgi:hypothetical protein